MIPKRFHAQLFFDGKYCQWWFYDKELGIVYDENEFRKMEYRLKERWWLTGGTA